MKYTIHLVAIAILLASCGAQTADPVVKMQPKATSIGTLKEYYNYLFDSYRVVDAKYYFLGKHRDELLKSLEVVEEVEIEKDVFLVFYKYAIGTDVIKKTDYLRKVDGLYLPYSKYYSEYDEDPFKNGKGEEAKILLKKAAAWDDNQAWWAK